MERGQASPRWWTKLGWDRLATRRLCRDATMLYKVVHNKVSILLPDFIVRGDSRTWGASPNKFRTIQSSCVLHYTLFYPRTVTLCPEPAACPLCDCDHSQGIPHSGPPCYNPNVNCSADLDFSPPMARFYPVIVCIVCTLGTGVLQYSGATLFSRKKNWRLEDKYFE